MQTRPVNGICSKNDFSQSDTCTNFGHEQACIMAHDTS